MIIRSWNSVIFQGLCYKKKFLIEPSLLVMENDHLVLFLGAVSGGVGVVHLQH